MNLSLITKAHNLLSKGDVNEAIFVSNCLDEIFKAPSLSKQELDMFSLLYLKLLDRLFGEETTSAPDAAGHSASSASSWVKGSLGGWMRALCQQTSTAGAGSTGVDSLGHPGSKLLKHFLPNRPAFSMLSESDYELKISLLPPKLQMLLGSHYLYHIFATPAHGRIVQQLLRTPATIGREMDRKTVLRLDANEYFLFCLVRYPTLSHHLSPFANLQVGPVNAGAHGPPSMVVRERGCYAWAQHLPYLNILQAYLQEYFPFGPANDIQSTALVPSGKGPGSRYQELFLRLITEYWINSANVVHKDFDKLATYRKQLYTSSPSYVSGQFDSFAAAAAHRGHPSPLEAVLLDGNVSIKFTLASCQSIYLVLFSMLLDPAISQQLSEGTASMLLQMQLPLFDMIRCILQKGEQSAVDRELCRMAVQIWLLLLQPWAVNGQTGKLDRARPYISSKWRPYVAHSLHFYTTVLAAFFKMFAKLNLSPSDNEDMRNVFILEDVLVLFSNGALQADIDDLQRSYLQSQERRWADSAAPSTPTRRIAPNDTLEIEMISVREHHERLFPDRSADQLPNLGLILPKVASLEACAAIACSLDHLRSDGHGNTDNGLIGRAFARLEAMLGGNADANDGPAVRRAIRCHTLLLAWNPEISMFISSTEAAVGSGPGAAISTSGDGYRDVYTSKLTPKGKAALQAGLVKCQASDVQLTKDELDLPFASYEWPAVVRVAVKLSKALNRRFALPRASQTASMSWQAVMKVYHKDVDGSLSWSAHFHLLKTICKDCFRFNLRFLATYRLIGAVMLYVALRLLARGLSWLTVIPLLLAAYAVYLLYSGSFPYYSVEM